MGILDKIKYGLDIPRWQQLSPVLTTHVAGVCWCSDKRNDISALDVMFQLGSASILNVAYGPTGTGGYIANPGLSAFGAGSDIVFVPSFMYVGTVGSGSTVSKIITSAFTDTEGTSVSQTLDSLVLGEKASGILGFKVRVIYSASGSSGKIEERFVSSNTAGTTPTLYVNYPLTQAPISGDKIEIIGCRVFCLGTTAGATQFRSFDGATSTMTSKANTTLTIATDSAIIALDEQYVPYNSKPGQGMIWGTGTYDTGYAAFTKYCLTATATGASSITGQSSGGDVSVLANEYRNFQIRIIEDTATPTAVGQRRLIASHTAGASPVYTLGAAWSVTPSSTAKYVIELPNQIILSTVAAGTATYTYNFTNASMTNGTGTIAVNTWSSTYYGARSAAVAAGCFTIPSWGHQPTTNPDGTRNSRHSYIYSFRGGSITLDMLDIAGGTAGAWTNGVSYNAQQTSFSTGSGADYAPVDNQGQWGYILLNTTGLCYRFNVKNRSIFPWPNTPIQSGTAAVGNRIVNTAFIDPTSGDKLTKIHVQGHTTTYFYRSEAII